MVDAGGAIQIVGVCSWVPLTGPVPRKSDANISLRGTLRQRCRGVRTETTALLLAVGFPSEEPFAILASKADQTYINGSVAFEAAPKSPH